MVVVYRAIRFKVTIFPAWGNDGLPRVVVYDVNDAMATEQKCEKQKTAVGLRLPFLLLLQSISPRRSTR